MVRVTLEYQTHLGLEATKRDKKGRRVNEACLKKQNEKRMRHGFKSVDHNHIKTETDGSQFEIENTTVTSRIQLTRGIPVPQKGKERYKMGWGGNKSSLADILFTKQPSDSVTRPSFSTNSLLRGGLKLVKDKSLQKFEGAVMVDSGESDRKERPLPLLDFNQLNIRVKPMQETPVMKITKGNSLALQKYTSQFEQKTNRINMDIQSPQRSDQGVLTKKSLVIQQDERKKSEMAKLPLISERFTDRYGHNKERDSDDISIDKGRKFKVTKLHLSEQIEKRRKTVDKKIYENLQIPQKEEQRVSTTILDENSELSNKLRERMRKKMKMLQIKIKELQNSKNVSRHEQQDLQQALLSVDYLDSHSFITLQPLNSLPNSSKKLEDLRRSSLDIGSSTDDIEKKIMISDQRLEAITSRLAKEREVLEQERVVLNQLSSIQSQRQSVMRTIQIRERLEKAKKKMKDNLQDFEQIADIQHPKSQLKQNHKTPKLEYKKSEESEKLIENERKYVKMMSPEKKRRLQGHLTAEVDEDEMKRKEEFSRISKLRPDQRGEAVEALLKEIADRKQGLAEEKRMRQVLLQKLWEDQDYTQKVLRTTILDQFDKQSRAINNFDHQEFLASVSENPIIKAVCELCTQVNDPQYTFLINQLEKGSNGLLSIPKEKIPILPQSSENQYDDQNERTVDSSVQMTQERQQIINSLLLKQVLVFLFGPSLSPLFTTDHSEQLDEFGVKVKLLSDFQKIASAPRSSTTYDQFKQTALMKYIEACQQNNTTLLPILAMIRDNGLVLANYVLGEGVSKSLGESLHVNPQLLTQIVLVNNNLSDRSLAFIFSGLHAQTRVKKIHIIGNTLQQAALLNIIPIFQKKRPFNLVDFRIEQSQTSQGILGQLLETLLEHPLLESLGIVGLTFSKSSFIQIKQYIRKSKKMQNLDISRNKLTESQMGEILEILASNRKLMSLNLSHNIILSPAPSYLPQTGNLSQREMEKLQKSNIPSLVCDLYQQSQRNQGGNIDYGNNPKKRESLIIENQSQQEERDDERETDLREMRKNMKTVVEKQIVARLERKMDMEEKAIANLCKFIKYNQRLLHLDLEQTGLSYNGVRQLSTCLNKSRGLMVLHLSGNPGVKDENFEFIKERIRSKEESDKDLKIEVSGGRSEEDKLGEKFQLAAIRHELFQTRHDRRNIGDQNQLTIQRFLGHKYDMPGSAQWRLSSSSSQCFICDRHVYSLIFWTHQVGHLFSLKLDQYELTQIVSNISKQQIPSFDDLGIVGERIRRQMAQINQIDQRPIIIGDMTGWLPKWMLTVQELALSFDSDFINEGMFGKIKQLGLVGSNVNSESDLRNTQEMFKYKKVWQEQIDLLTENWPDLIREGVKYQRPFLVNLDKISQTKNHQVFVFPCFLKPGKQTYTIVQNQQLSAKIGLRQSLPQDISSYSVHQVIVTPRDEDPVPFSKPMKSVKKGRKFKLETSVFKDWKPDNSLILDKCLKNDFSLWKAARFCKEPEELDKVMEVFSFNFPFIKDIYHHLISKSNYPGIGWQDFTQYAISIKLPDEKVPVATIDRAFVAANVDLEKKSDLENSLNRYKFLEILLRVAKAKYIETGVTKQYPESLKMLINLNMKKHEEVDEWQGFREKHLWTVPVNDLLEANLQSLKDLYESFFDPRKKIMDLADTHQLFYKATKILAKESDVTYCFGMSKMTVIIEDNPKKYSQLLFPEFLEMIGRVAQFKFGQNSQIGLEQKIEAVLDEILPLIGAVRKDPETVEADESESDDDY